MATKTVKATASVSGDIAGMRRARGEQIKAVSGRILATDYADGDTIQFSIGAHSIVGATFTAQSVPPSVLRMTAGTDLSAPIALPVGPVKVPIDYLIQYRSGTGASPKLLVGLGSVIGGGLQVARCTFDPTGNAAHRTIGAHTLGATIPAKAIVVGGFVDVPTALTSLGSATVAVSVEGADDIVAAVVLGSAWAAGKHAIVPKSNTPESTGVKTTVDRLVTATVAVAALTAGKAEIFLFYVLSS